MIFLIKFDRLLKDHAAMCPPGGGLSDHLKCTYLKNAIMPIPNLASIFSSQENFNEIVAALSSVSVPGFILPGPNYDCLVQQACAQATICNQSRNAAHASSRRASTHHQSSTVDSSDSEAETQSSNDFDVPEAEILAFSPKAQYRKTQKKKGSSSRHVNLTKETWQKLSEPAKAAWAKGHANMSDVAEHPGPDPEPDPDPGPNPDRDDRHVHSSDTSKPTKPSPGSLQSILYSKRTRGASQSKQTTFKTHVTYVSSSGGYRVLKHRSVTASCSLVDRGANGGLAGSADLRVISVNPSRELTITGIDNHQMKDLDVV
jgi:hypothetical protein